MPLWITLLLDAGCAVAAGVVTSFWLDGEQGFLAGLGSFIAVEIIRLRQRAQHIHTTLLKLSRFIEALRGSDAFSELRLLYGLRPAIQMSTHDLSVPKSDVLRFWRDCLARAQTQWFVLSYSRPDETWELGWGRNTSTAIQRERLDEGCHIRRVFVVDSVTEKDAMHQLLVQQKTMGIDVRWILKDELLSNRKASEAFKKVGSLDVAVVDGTWLFRTQLDRARRIVFALASIDKQLIDHAKFLIDEAYMLGHAVQEADSAGSTTSETARGATLHPEPRQ